MREAILSPACILIDRMQRFSVEPKRFFGYEALHRIGMVLTAHRQCLTCGLDIEQS